MGIGARGGLPCVRSDLPMDKTQQGKQEWWRRLFLTCIGLLLLALIGALAAPEFRRAAEPLVDLSSPAASGGGGAATAHKPGLRFAVAATWSVESTFSTYQRLVRRIARDVGREEVFLLRPSYAALREIVEKRDVDVALACTGPYVCSQAAKRMKLLVKPEFTPALKYRSVVLVPANSTRTDLTDLCGCTMGFSDRESFTGYFVPCAALADRGLDPGRCLKKMVFTGNHERSIQAVAGGIVDAAAVHSVVWHSAVKEDPTLPERVRELWVSDTYGEPPVVVPAGLDHALEEALLRAFLSLDGDAEGQEILAALGIVRFVRAKEEDYRSAAELYARLKSAPGMESRF